MYRFISYLKFLLSATNQHGVHSPFVYGFVTKGLYLKGNKNLSIAENVVAKSISYFSHKNICLTKDADRFKLKLNVIFENLDYATFPFDIIYANALKEDPTPIGEEYFHNETMLIVTDIYTNKKTHAMWNRLKDKEHVRVTVDVYHCGMVFFRKEQAKEHFKIRI